MKLLKPSLATLSGASLPTLKHSSPEQIVQRVSGNTMRALKKRALARSGWQCECDVCQAGYPIKLTWQRTELDHIVPVHRGGTNAIGNLRAVDIDCHARITAQQRARGSADQGWTEDAARARPVRRPGHGDDDNDMPC